MAIKEAIEQEMFDNDRDAARALTSIPFHLRRPNQALYEEISHLAIPADNGNHDHKFTHMALPLVRAHLARRVCELSGRHHHGSGHHSEDFNNCIHAIVDPLADEVFGQLVSGTYEEKMLALSALENLRMGKVATLLEPVISGETPIDHGVRAHAIHVAGHGDVAPETAIQWFLPVYLDVHNCHEVRISALQAIFDLKPDATTLSTIMSSLFMEADYEVVNFAFTIFERYANTINPCSKTHSHQNLAGYFLKYMKQAGFHKTSYGFGVSKTFAREFQKEKYGYGGAYEFATIGSHESTTPLVVEFAVTSNLYHGYEATALKVHLRVEGLAKALIRKFKKIPEAQWQLNDLASLLRGMGVQQKEDQPLRVEVALSIKGAVVFQRLYDETANQPGGKIYELIEQMKGISQSATSKINHQRGGTFGMTLYEQPTDLGVAMSHMTMVTTIASIKATRKASTQRGTVGREIDYDINLFTHGATMMGFHNSLSDNHFAIVQSRVHGSHMPRTIKVHVNFIGEKSLKLSVSRPSYDHPMAFLMHSHTATVLKNEDPRADTGLTRSCPTCVGFHILTKGNAYQQERTILDRTNDFIGSYLKAEYFQCEMDISRKNTFKNAIGAFSPANKNPKTPWTMYVMGMRQIRAFFLYFPRAEQCGMYLRWSQSQQNPVTEVSVKLTAKKDDLGTPIGFFRGKKIMVKVNIVAKGQDESTNREYKGTIGIAKGPGGLQNKIDVKIGRKANPAVGMPEAMVCLQYKSKYPDFGDEMMVTDMDQDLAVTGTAMVNYGVPTGSPMSCSNLPTAIQVKFVHSTTAESRADARSTENGQQCAVDMELPEWQARVRNGGLPLTMACYMTAYDAAAARKYTWSMRFKGLTQRLKGILSKAQTVLKAGLIPYYDIDPEALSGSVGNSPFLNISMEFKNHEEVYDMRIATSYGTTEFLDTPVRMPGWSKRFRNLKYDSKMLKMAEYRLLHWCVQTTRNIQTMDDVKLPYTPQPCWSLVSSHCSPNPTYAVFTKQEGADMAMRVYIGGHLIEFSGGSVTVAGAAWHLQDKVEKKLEVGGEEIVGITKWGHTYMVYSYLKVMILFDGHFVEVIPAPSVKGQHCGACGNFDGNPKNELIGKNGQDLVPRDNIANAWCDTP